MRARPIHITRVALLCAGIASWAIGLSGQESDRWPRAFADGGSEGHSAQESASDEDGFDTNARGSSDAREGEAQFRSQESSTPQRDATDDRDAADERVPEQNRADLRLLNPHYPQTGALGPESGAAGPESYSMSAFRAAAYNSEGYDPEGYDPEGYDPEGYGLDMYGNEAHGADSHGVEGFETGLYAGVPEELESAGIGSCGPDGCSRRLRCIRWPDWLRPGPLNESWAYRPWGVSWFLGPIWGDDLIASRVDQKAGLLGGYRIALDMDPHIGFETRMAFTSMKLGYARGNPLGRKSDVVMWDLDLMYYPTGESRFRPFFTTGIGIVDVDFRDETGYGYDELVLGMPFGCGFKYRWDRYLILRMDLRDNLAFAATSGLETMHNFSMTFGLEFRFGGPKTRYFPWQPGRGGW